MERQRLGMILVFILTQLQFFADCTANGMDLVTKLRQEKCQRRYRFNSRLTCCHGYPKWTPPGRTVNCCGPSPYIQGAQICCGNEIQSKSENSLTSGKTLKTSLRKCCARKKPYVYGKELCCSKEVVDSSKYGCCRNAKYERAFATCCAGEITPIFSMDANVTIGCCGKEAYDTNKQMCCNFELFDFLGDKKHTRCCKTFPYDDRTHICCNFIREKQPGKDSCCHGKLMDSKTHICCNFKKQKRIYGEHTQCCRSDNYRKGLRDYFEIYNSKSQLCCGGKIVVRTGQTSSCCIQESYNVKKQICCGGKVYNKELSWCSKYRCCGKKVFCADKKICCAGQYNRGKHRETIYSFRKPNEGSKTRCCGWRKYDISKHECLANNVLRRHG